MFFRLFSWLFDSWPADLPRLYPKLYEFQLAPFLTEDEYHRLQGLDNVYILPFAGANDSAEEVRLGRGMARLMMRNLMLLPDVSIHGPEDTPDVEYDAVENLASANPKSCYVSGVVGREKSDFSLQLAVYRPGRPPSGATVQSGRLDSFVRECSATIGRSLGSRLETTVADGWDVGQPAHIGSLLRYGDLLLRFDADEKRERAEAAKGLMAEDPGFALPAWEIDEELPKARGLYLKALQRDPYNAQLCFQLFCALFQGRGPQLEAYQYCRKAIELSPGHGKAHMCAPHAAPVGANMLPHSELGYRLLPGNSFAITNYINNLWRRGAERERLLELAEEGIAVDPHDPGSYQLLIDLFCDMGEYAVALDVAERLQQLFEPVMDERALYCLKQSPVRARQMESGEYDPVAETRRLISKLRRKAGIS
jgi:tetratricopeptide (TPR) repeat protein